MDHKTTDISQASEPVNEGYEDSVEGMLQYHADRSLWFKEQVRSAKTQVKRDYYQKKLEKNNKNLWKLLVRTPNAYNPLMKWLEAPAVATEETADETIIVPYSQVADENGEFPVPPEGTLTTTAQSEGQV